MRYGGRGRIGGTADPRYGGTASFLGVVLLRGTGLGEGRAAAYLQQLQPLGATGAGLGTADAHLQQLLTLLGGGPGAGDGAAMLQQLLPLIGTSIGEGDGEMVLVGVFALGGASLGLGAGDALLVGRFALAGAGAGEGLGAADVDQLRTLGGVSLGEGTAEAAIERARLLAEHGRFYLDTSRGVVPTLGGLPVFSRASSAPTEDPAGRPFTALPNTPRFPWVELDGRRRPVLRLEKAKAGPPVQAVDRLYWGSAPAPARLGIYLRYLVDFDPAGSGHLLWLSDLTNAAPHLRVRYSAGQVRAQLHNGAASAEVAAAIGAVQGGAAELLVLLGEVEGSLELITAAASGAAPFPAGGLPGGWSGSFIVANGYDQFPTDQRLAFLKIFDAGGLARAGAGRLQEARDFVLDPAGQLVDA